MKKKLALNKLVMLFYLRVLMPNALQVTIKKITANSHKFYKTNVIPLQLLLKSCAKIYFINIKSTRRVFRFKGLAKAANANYINLNRCRRQTINGLIPTMFGLRYYQGYALILLQSRERNRRLHQFLTYQRFKRFGVFNFISA